MKEYQDRMEGMDNVVLEVNRESVVTKDFREIQDSNRLLDALVPLDYPDFLVTLDFLVHREKMEGLETKDLEVMIVESVLLQGMVRKENQEMMEGLDNLEGMDFPGHQDQSDQRENVAIVEVLAFLVLL